MPYPPVRQHLTRRLPTRHFLKGRTLAFITILALCSIPFFVHNFIKAKTRGSQSNSPPAKLARLSETVSIHAAGRGNPTINLSDGHDLLTSYLGPDELRQALERNLAEPLSLASADFDEDGVPDLISGYAYNGRGIITLLRGNVDSIYQNAPEAKERKANGTFTDAPFLSPAQVFSAPILIVIVIGTWWSRPEPITRSISSPAMVTADFNQQKRFRCGA
ncbi:MAG: hypothetical protein DMF74_21685 [Acidobacteria bacterium]|nr:MAG: hypothetical protein DMF74_21685 [Acidobacteriota bacterium]